MRGRQPCCGRAQNDADTSLPDGDGLDGVIGGRFARLQNEYGCESRHECDARDEKKPVRGFEPE
jgi:hypothetical protein